MIIDTSIVKRMDIITTLCYYTTKSNDNFISSNTFVDHLIYLLLSCYGHMLWYFSWYKTFLKIMHNLIGMTKVSLKM